MSVVKVQGNASGTGIFTIAAPATNTDRTLTLPDQTGTILTNAGPYTASSSATAGAVTIDASNNVGIGVTPSAWASNRKAIEGSGDFLFAAKYPVVVGNAYFDSGGAWRYKVTGAATQYVQGDGVHYWYNAASGTAGNAISFTQAMTLDSSGNLLVGTTSFSLGRVNIGGYTNGDRFGLVMRPSANNATPILFQNAAGTDIGSIATTSTATSYNTSSDYRLKNSIAPMTGALAKVQALKPVTYKWNADGSEGEGFIAHELAEICPQAVTGEKDAVDADGNPQYQGIDVSFLVATLTAALQELNAKVAALEARLASDGPSNGGQA